MNRRKRLSAAMILGPICGAALAPWPAMAQGREIDEQIVTGSRIPMQRARAGSAVTVLSGEYLRNAGIAYAAEALRHVPGVAVSRTGSHGGLTQIRMRGAESNHVLVLIDGVEVAPAGSGEFDFSSLLTADIDRIEVVRGPQSGIYGSNAVAGVIHIITRGGGASGVTAALEGGSRDTYQVTGGGRLAGERGFLTLTGTRRATDGISVAPTGSERDGDRNLSLSGRGRLVLSNALRLDGNIRYADKHTETDDQDFSGGPLQGLVVDSDSHADTTDLSAGTTGTLALAGGDWVSTASAAYTENETDGYSVSPYGSKSTRRTFGTATRYDFDIGATGHTLLGFVEHEHETYRNTYPSDPSQVEKQKRDLLGVGAEYHLRPLPGLSLLGALRRDDNDAFQDATTFRVAAAYVLAATGSRLHGGYGTGVTNPTFFEQFGFLPDQFTGNPNLKPEKARSWEIGLEQAVIRDRLSVDVTYFRAELENEITSRYPTVVNMAGESRRRGVEAALTAHPAPGLDLSASYSFVKSTDPDGGREVRRPRHLASFDATYSFPGDRVILHLGAAYNGAQLDDDYRGGFTPVKARLAAYTLVNAMATYRVVDGVTLYGRLENLADEDYQAVLGTAAPGRAVFAGLRLRHDS